MAAELYSDGIDVVVVHPSPTSSNFFKKAGAISALKLFQKTAQPPDYIASAIFSSAGRYCVRDQGYFSIFTKLVLKVIDWNVLAEIMKYALGSNSDYQSIKKKRK